MAEKKPKDIRMRTPVGEGCLTGLQVSSLGHLPRKREWIHARFDLVAVGLVVQGSGRFRVNGGAWQAVGPGMALAVYPGAVFEYGPEAGGWWEEHYVSFTGAWAAGLVGGLVPRMPQLVKVADVQGMVERFRELHGLARRLEAGDGDRLTLAALQMLAEMKWGAAPGDADDPVQRVVAYCRKHAAEEIPFEELAAREGISYSLLRQRMRAVTGLAPAKFVAKLRCDAARTLLRTTTLPIKQIARRVGIADPFVFSRVFHRTVGVSPKVYRESVNLYGEG